MRPLQKKITCSSRQYSQFMFRLASYCQYAKLSSISSQRSLKDFSPSMALQHGPMMKQLILDLVKSVQRRNTIRERKLQKLKSYMIGKNSPQSRAVVLPQNSSAYQLFQLPQTHQNRYQLGHDPEISGTAGSAGASFLSLQAVLILLSATLPTE